MKTLKITMITILLLVTTIGNIHSITTTTVAESFLNVQFYSKHKPPIIWPYSLNEKIPVNGILYSNNTFEIIFEEALDNITISIYKGEQIIEERIVTIEGDLQTEIFMLNEYGNGDYIVCLTLSEDEELYGEFSITE